MPFTIIDPNDLLDDGIFKEDPFMKKVTNIDWSQYQDQKILIRGCTSSIIPPWAYMVLTGKLTSFAKSIRFGNEHDHIVIFRQKK